MCVFEKDEESQDDTGHDEGALEGEHRDSLAGGRSPGEQDRRWRRLSGCKRASKVVRGSENERLDCGEEEVTRACDQA